MMNVDNCGSVSYMTLTIPNTNVYSKKIKRDRQTDTVQWQMLLL